VLALVTVTIAICILGAAVSRALVELSLSLQPAEFEVQNIEFIEEELLENQRVEDRYTVIQNESGKQFVVPNRYSIQTLTANGKMGRNKVYSETLNKLSVKCLKILVRILFFCHGQLFFFNLCALFISIILN
jgi:hypothetical protein